MWRLSDGVEHTLLSDPMPATGRGLSGGVHQWSHDGSQLCVALADGGLLVLKFDGEMPISKHVAADVGWWTTPVFSRVDNSVIAVRDWHDIVRLSPTELQDVQWTQEQLFHDGDFAWDLDEYMGASVFHAWNRPHMPWTQSRLVSDNETIRRSLDNVAYQQPRVCRDGSTFGYISDRNGVRNITVIRDGIEVSIDDACEHAGPTWGSGLRTWSFNTDGTMVAYTRNEDGYGSLWVRPVIGGVSPVRIGRAVHGCVSWEDDSLVAIRSGAKTPPEMVCYDMSQIEQLLSELHKPEKRIVFYAGDSRWHDDAVRDHGVEPTVIKVASTQVNNLTITVRLYQPEQPNGALLSWVHGGPNDQWQVSFMPRHLFWLSRGYTIAVIDHRGSTGYGRAFQQSLEGHWGDGDAYDVIDATRHVQQMLSIDVENTVLLGSSAGGLSVLGAVVRSAADPIASAVVASYPVVDLLSLARADDPFEAHYVPTLVGARGDDDSVWTQRSPHSQPSAFIGVPVLIFHGDSDPVVPLSHSVVLRDAVTSVGGEVTVHVMAGEGHGFRQRHNQEFEYVTTEQFLQRFVP